jgi:hypothetical protein
LAEKLAKAGRSHDWAELVAPTMRGALAVRIGETVLPQTTNELAKAYWAKSLSNAEVNTARELDTRYLPEAPQLLALLEICDLARFAQANLGADELLAATASARALVESLFIASRASRIGTRGANSTPSRHRDRSNNTSNRCPAQRAYTDPRAGIPMIHFEHPAVLLLLLPLALIAFWLARRGRPPAVSHSNLDLIRAVAKQRRTRWARFLACASLGRGRTHDRSSGAT